MDETKSPKCKSQQGWDHKGHGSSNTRRLPQSIAFIAPGCCRSTEAMASVALVLALVPIENFPNEQESVIFPMKMALTSQRYNSRPEQRTLNDLPDAKSSSISTSS